MDIRLVSTDSQLYKLCRETLAGFRSSDWTLDMKGAPDSGELPADLYIWDCDSDVALPSQLNFDQEQKNIFLVSRKKMGALRDRLPMAAVAILLSAALLAGYLPARKASRIDPMIAVRHE